MTALEYFTKKATLIKVVATSEVLADFIEINGHAPDADVAEENRADFEKLFLQFILTLLLYPNIAEGDMKIDFKRESLQMFYEIECGRLGVRNELTASRNEVVDMSSLA